MREDVTDCGQRIREGTQPENKEGSAGARKELISDFSDHTNARSFFTCSAL